MSKSYVLRELDGEGSKIATQQTAATEEICSVVVTDAENNALVGQKAMAASMPVVVASDQAVIPVDATGQGDLPTKPFDGVQEGGLTELIGSTEQVDAADYGGSIGVALGAAHSGELLMVTLYTSEIGTGAVLQPDGTLYVFDADPTISPGDLVMSAAERETSLGHIVVADDEWVGDANGAQCSKKLDPILFHSLSTLYFVWFNGAVPFNDDAGVAKFEILKFNFWYRRDS
jgi:hypothetical protein